MRENFPNMLYMPGFSSTKLNNLWKIGIDICSLTEQFLTVINSAGPSLFWGTFPQILERAFFD